MLYEHSWPRAHRESESSRQHSKAARDRIRERSVVLSRARPFPNIAYFPVPRRLLLFVMVPFFIIKDVERRSSDRFKAHLVQTFVWLFEE